jgi:hypothetical protein
MKTSDIIIGIGLIILGLIFLFENFGYIEFDFKDVWPVFVLLAGLAFWLGFLKDRKNYGLIMPGTILIIYSLMFWYCTAEGWYYMTILWPGFLIGPGLGFFLMYLLGEKEKGLLVPATILTAIGILLLFRYSGVLRYWPVILVVIGIILILKSQFKSTKSEKSF